MKKGFNKLKTQSNINIIAEEKFIDKLISLLTIIKLTDNIDVRENFSLPYITLNSNIVSSNEIETYFSYEFSKNNSWLFDIKLNFKHLNRQKEKLKKGRMTLEQSKNYLSSISIIFFENDDVDSPTIYLNYDLNYDEFFNKVEYFIGEG